MNSNDRRLVFLQNLQAAGYKLQVVVPKNPGLCSNAWKLTSTNPADFVDEKELKVLYPAGATRENLEAVLKHFEKHFGFEGHIVSKWVEDQPGVANLHMQYWSGRLSEFTTSGRRPSLIPGFDYHLLPAPGVKPVVAISVADASGVGNPDIASCLAGGR